MGGVVLHGHAGVEGVLDGLLVAVVVPVHGGLVEGLHVLLVLRLVEPFLLVVRHVRHAVASLVALVEHVVLAVPPLVVLDALVLARPRPLALVDRQNRVVHDARYRRLLRPLLRLH